MTVSLFLCQVMYRYHCQTLSTINKNMKTKTPYCSITKTMIRSINTMINEKSARQRKCHTFRIKRVHQSNQTNWKNWCHNEKIKTLA